MNINELQRYNVENGDGESTWEEPDKNGDYVRWEDLENLATRSPFAAEVNRRRGEMAGLRETLRENGIEGKTILQGIHELLIYKQAMDSMAAQMIHPKMTGMEMAKLQLTNQK
jgi:hypothetical protein